MIRQENDDAVGRSFERSRVGVLRRWMVGGRSDLILVSSSAPHLCCKSLDSILDIREVLGVGPQNPKTPE